MLQETQQNANLAFLESADSILIAEHLIAFANGTGGRIVLGVNQNGVRVAQVDPDDATSSLQDAMGQCRPPVMSQWEQEEDGIIAIRVARSPDLHSLADGRVLIRRGAINVPASGSELHKLATHKTIGNFEEDLVPGAKYSDLDTGIIDEYMLKREARGAARIGTVREMMYEIGATDINGNPTVSGILLYGKSPQIFLPQSRVVFVKFPGTKPRNSEGSSGMGYGRREEIAGPMYKVIEQTWNVVFQEMSKHSEINGLAREDVTEYPRFAVREALVNAICHRDYRIKGRSTEVRMYADRMEIISPGGLPGYMTIDNLVDEHYSRNPNLVNGLYYWGYIEELGLGIDQMIEEMIQAGHPTPDFKSQPYSFTVILNKADKPAKPAGWATDGGVSERQAIAIQYVRQNGSITNREYQRVCPYVSAETLRRDLAELVTQGLLLKIGSKKGTNYIMK